MLYGLLVSLAFAAPEPKTVVAPYVGLQIGPSFSFKPLTPGVLPRLNVGIELPQLKRRFRIGAFGSFAHSATKSTLPDPRVPTEEWSYLVRHDQGLVGGGLTVSFPDFKVPLVPEVSAGSYLSIYRVSANGAADGAEFGETKESYQTAGFWYSVGAHLKLGPGELSLVALGTIAPTQATIVGDTNTSSIAPMLGYLYVF